MSADLADPDPDLEVIGVSSLHAGSDPGNHSVPVDTLDRFVDQGVVGSHKASSGIRECQASRSGALASVRRYSVLACPPNWRPPVPIGRTAWTANKSVQRALGMDVHHEPGEDAPCCRHRL
jgi:hypothetical protein